MNKENRLLNEYNKKLKFLISFGQGTNLTIVNTL